MFRDAVEHFELLTRNPVKRKLSPSVPKKEAEFLAAEDLKKLLLAVRGSVIESGVWLQIYLGLRIGEVQAAKWFATHGLRHSTSQLYFDKGATKDHIQKLFVHSKSGVTEGYNHDNGSRLQKVAKIIRLFPTDFLSDVSQKFPKLENEEKST